MSRATELRNTLDDLILSADQIEALSHDFDLYAIRDMLFRLHQEVRDVQRELLLIDADALIGLARTFGAIR